jgi:hypothetical protein
MLLAIHQAAVDEMKVASAREKENLNVCNAKSGAHTARPKGAVINRGAACLSLPPVLCCSRKSHDACYSREKILDVFVNPLSQSSRAIQSLRTWIAASTPRSLARPALSLIARHNEQAEFHKMRSALCKDHALAQQESRTLTPIKSSSAHVRSTRFVLLYIRYILHSFLCSARICTNSFLAFYQK